MSMIPYNPKIHKGLPIYEIQDQKVGDRIVTGTVRVTDAETLRMVDKHPQHFWVDEDSIKFVVKE